MNPSEGQFVALDGRFAALQIPGKRAYQEDDYGLIARGTADRNGSEVLVVADGMGGQVSGDTASGTVIRTFIETFPNATGPIPDRLRACLEAANNALAAAIDDNPHLDGMGTTVVAVVVSQRLLAWISVGDSPLWLFRDGQLRRLNADHSMAAVFADWVAAGRMTEEEAATDPKRHALRSAVMGDPIHLIDVSSQPVELKKSDWILLASDGLLTLAEREIERILQNMQDAPLSEVTEALVQAVEAVGHPHQDNTTVLLYTPEADRDVASVAADPIQEESNAGNSLFNQIRQRLRQIKKIGRFGIAVGIVLLAALFGYWFWSSKDTPVETLTPGETPAAPRLKGDAPDAQTEGDSTQAPAEKAQPTPPATSNKQDTPAPSTATTTSDSQAAQPPLPP